MVSIPPGRLAGAVATLAFGLAACATERTPVQQPPRDGDVIVSYDSTLHETRFTIASGDCTISWTSYGTETNRGVIRHRSNCTLPLGEQTPLIQKVLQKVRESDADTAAFRTLSWGRLTPDEPHDATMAVRLAQAARRSPEWDPVRGVPRIGDINGWVRTLANEAIIYVELLNVFNEAGLDLQVASVEKVLVMPAGQLPFFERLRVGGASARDRVPFDFQTWFSVRRKSR